MGVLVGNYEPRPKSSRGADRFRWEEAVDLLALFVASDAAHHGRQPVDTSTHHASGYSHLVGSHWFRRCVRYRDQVAAGTLQFALYRE